MGRKKRTSDGNNNSFLKKKLKSLKSAPLSPHGADQSTGGIVDIFQPRVYWLLLLLFSVFSRSSSTVTEFVQMQDQQPAPKKKENMTRKNQ